MKNTEKVRYMHNSKNGKIGRIPVVAWVFIALGILAVAARLTAAYNPAFADLWNDGPAYVLRRSLAFLTSWIPFSVAEYIVLASPVLVVLTVFITLDSAERKGFLRALVCLASAVALVFSVFTFSFGIGYCTTPLGERLAIDEYEVNNVTLYDTQTELIGYLNGLEDGISRRSDGSSVNPHTHSETVELLSRAYDRLNGQYGFIKSFRAPVKVMITSPVLTYTFITGEYTFYTGEANINNNYSAFSNVFTTAHEMAHQRGISREDEANFVAFLACINSDDDYIRYAGYLSLYQYVANALYDESPSMYARALGKLNDGAVAELKAERDFLRAYSGTVAAEVSDRVNDAYLSAQGTEGVKSYGLVVRFAVAYYANRAD